MSKYYMTRLFAFLRQLSANNNREWFKDHKAEYDELRSHWIADLDRLISLMCSYEPGMKTQSGKECTYRIYRDTRFSPDKTPYKLHFAALLSPFGRKTTLASDYLHVGMKSCMADCGFYGGLWMPEQPVLKKVRKAIIDNIEEFEDILHAPELVTSGATLVGDRLKTVPKGYDRNHPQAELLRMKEYGLYIPADEKLFSSPEWVDKAAETFRLFKPLNDFLNYSITEE